MTVAGLLSFFRTPTRPLPPLRSEILSEIDHQVGRLSSVRDRAVELIEKIESGNDAQPE